MAVQREAFRQMENVASSSAFDGVYLAEHPRVLRHLVYLTGDRVLAEDLAQEAFQRLIERSDLSELRDPGAWLLTVASNLAYNHFRGETRRTERERRVAVKAAGDVDDVLDVRRALEALEPRDRAVLLLRHSGFSYAEVADVIGVQASSVGTILARAQRRFREAYEGPLASTED